jgi:hypothetical protein
VEEIVAAGILQKKKKLLPLGESITVFLKNKIM